MAVVFAEKSICVLIVGGGCEGKTRFEDVAGLKKFVGDGVGCGNWSDPKFGGKNGRGGGGERLLLSLLLLPSGLNVSLSQSLFSLDPTVSL